MISADRRNYRGLIALRCATGADTPVAVLDIGSGAWSLVLGLGSLGSWSGSSFRRRNARIPWVNRRGLGTGEFVRLFPRVLLAHGLSLMEQTSMADEHHGTKELASAIRAGVARRPEQAFGDYFV